MSSMSSFSLLYPTSDSSGSDTSSGISGGAVFAACMPLARYSVNAPCPVPASNISNLFSSAEFWQGDVGLRSRRETIRLASWE